ncbi:Rid family hydrolase [Lysobacter enzymogenes]|uniref:Rid family hydrolase n=1 Tax=Lysobacter enzymogenes TaxID=69 RepID=UPI00089824EF|nr:Rid family hydrolase [Lysobacter enzymogenes]SDX97120.1 Enamine deaminase RidA, house cleaning of reactive enamine intermediates, YjgF/YER057c/UK114 family [Lysobacter enzymogenes]
MLRSLLPLCVSFVCCGAIAAPPAPQAAPPTREHFAPPGWEGSYHDLHYSPVVRIGDRVIVSGIPTPDEGDDEAKARALFVALRAHLRSAGADLDDVIELQSFHVARDQAEFRQRIEPVLKVHREFFKDHYPAWTAVAVSGLYSKSATFELRAEAVIGSGKAPRAQIDKRP